MSSSQEEPLAAESVASSSTPTKENGDESAAATEESPAANGSTEPEAEKLPEEDTSPKEEVAADENAGSEKPGSEVKDAPQDDEGKGDDAAEGEQVGEDEFEPMPEDLDDFVVLDEAEFSDSDDDEGPGQEGGEEEDEDAMQWDCELDRLAPRTYTDAQLKPTELDIRVKADWPLAGYWPVYVGNFRLYKKFDSDYNCFHAVHRYFASKGLPSFMVFRLKDSFFEEYQKRVGFYDMLVYFINKKDAFRAVKWCHRDLYYGHRLNVYDGRNPVMFPVARSYRFKHGKVEDKLETETNLEEYFNFFRPVYCISKQNLDSVLVQFCRSKRPFQLMKNKRVQAFALDEPIQKQRFIEKDVREQLLEEIAKNPKFLTMRLGYKMLVSIKHGVIPEMRRPWEQAEVDEAVIEQRRQVTRERRQYSSPGVRTTFKRRYDDFYDAPPAKTRRPPMSLDLLDDVQPRRPPIRHDLLDDIPAFRPRRPPVRHDLLDDMPPLQPRRPPMRHDVFHDVPALGPRRPPMRHDVFHDVPALGPRRPPMRHDVLHDVPALGPRRPPMRHDVLNDVSAPKSRRQLIREAKSLEQQLMSIKSEIMVRKTVPIPPRPRAFPPKKFIPRPAV